MKTDIGSEVLFKSDLLFLLCDLLTTINKHFAQRSKTVSKIFEIYMDSEKKIASFTSCNYILRETEELVKLC